jgi:hypothetical protein
MHTDSRMAGCELAGSFAAEEERIDPLSAHGALQSFQVVHAAPTY